MGLLTWIESKVTGVDLAAEQARGDALDAQIAANQKDNLDSGKWTVAQYEAANANQQKALTGDVTQQVLDAGKEGAIEGLNNLQQGVKNAVGNTLSFGWGMIPWQLWLVGGLALFIYMGGGIWIRGILEKNK